MLKCHKHVKYLWIGVNHAFVKKGHIYSVCTFLEYYTILIIPLILPDLEEGNGNTFPVKRIRIQCGAEDYSHIQKPLAIMPSFDTLKLPKTENTFSGMGMYSNFLEQVCLVSKMC